MTKSPKCLQLLLQHEWIQENIDEPIDLLNTNAKEDEKTTALHVAVSNGRYANAILLLDRFPKPRWSHKKTTEKDENIEEEEKETIERHPASINQKSAAGSVPLFVAVYLHDYKMVRILLACKTPIQLAEEIKKAYDEKKEKPQFQLPSQKELEIDDINKIVDALKNAESGEKKDSLEILKK